MARPDGSFWIDNERWNEMRERLMVDRRTKPLPRYGPGHSNVSIMSAYLHAAVDEHGASGILFRIA
jgi:hypothetical protein